MKIVIDARFWRKETGGIGRYSRELVKGLLRLKTDDQFIILITPLDKEQFDLKDQRIKGVVADIPHYSSAEQFKLPRLLKSFQPDLVHFLNFNQPIFYRGKRITTIHDLTVKKFPVGGSQTNPLKKWGFNLVMKQAARSNRLIAISRATKVDIVRDFRIDPERIKIIYESADDRFRPRPEVELADFRERTGLKKPYILFVNQWRPHKGLPELVEAFEKLRADGLDYQLVVAGRPNKHFPELERLIVESQVKADIVTPGFIPDEDLPLYYSAASCLAFPSHYEGFGLGVLEGLKSGIPVVASKVSSIPEVAGKAAHFVEPKNPVELAAGLKEVLTNDNYAQDLVKKGLEQAKKFSWDKMAAETYDLYREVVSEDR